MVFHRAERDSCKDEQQAQSWFIEKNAYALPTLEEVKEIYRQCREEWNNAAHPATGIARIDMYRMSENPETSPVQPVELIQMFWLTSAKEVTYTNAGLK